MNDSDPLALIAEAREHGTNEDGRCDTCMEWWVEFDSNGKPSRGHAIASAYPCLPARLADALEACLDSDWPARQRRIAARIAERYEEETP